jgi:hypothetical protein
VSFPTTHSLIGPHVFANANAVARSRSFPIETMPESTRLKGTVSPEGEGFQILTRVDRRLAGGERPQMRPYRVWNLRIVRLRASFH